MATEPKSLQAHDPSRLAKIQIYLRWTRRSPNQPPFKEYKLPTVRHAAASRYCSSISKLRDAAFGSEAEMATDESRTEADDCSKPTQN